MSSGTSVKLVYALIVPRIAYARVQRDAKSSVYYFDSLFVREPFRRRGIGTRLLLHAIHLVGSYPELDIRKTSYVAQRIATRAGFQMIGESTRYVGGNLWRNLSRFKNGDPQFATCTVKRHRNCAKKTEVHYLEIKGDRLL